MPQALQPGMRVTLAVGAEPRTQTGDNGADVLEAEVLGSAPSPMSPSAVVDNLPDPSSLWWRFYSWPSLKAPGSPDI